MKAQIQDAEMQLRSPDLVDIGRRGGVWAPNPKESAAHSGIASAKSARLKKMLEVEEEAIHGMKKKLPRIKTLEEEMSKLMAPSRFYNQKKQDTSDYNKTVKHLVDVELSPGYQRKAQELQNLYRARAALESRTAKAREDPDAGNLSHLRQA